LDDRLRSLEIQNHYLPLVLEVQVLAGVVQPRVLAQSRRQVLKQVLVRQQVSAPELELLAAVVREPQQLPSLQWRYPHLLSWLLLFWRALSSLQFSSLQSFLLAQHRHRRSFSPLLFWRAPFSSPAFLLPVERRALGLHVQLYVAHGRLGLLP
jgi:hypothetical protein